MGGKTDRQPPLRKQGRGRRQRRRRHLWSRAWRMIALQAHAAASSTQKTTTGRPLISLGELLQKRGCAGERNARLARGELGPILAAAAAGSSHGSVSTIQVGSRDTLQGGPGGGQEVQPRDAAALGRAGIGCAERTGLKAKVTARKTSATEWALFTNRGRKVLR